MVLAPWRTGTRRGNRGTFERTLFILRNFHDTPDRRYAEKTPVSTTVFVDSILPAKQRVIHVAIPDRAWELRHRCNRG